MRQILQLERSIKNKKLTLNTQNNMNNLSTQFITNNSQSDWTQKLINLQKQLIQARLQQQQLRRINKSLQDTIKVATKNESNDFNPTQRLSMNMTWKQKYQYQLQKNQQTQKYIKVLEKKKSNRNTLSLANHSNSKPKYNSNNRNASNYSTAVKSTSNYHYQSNTVKSNRNFTLFAENTQKSNKIMARHNSISKMDNFIDRLLSKDDCRLSQMPLNTRKFDTNCMSDKKNYQQRKIHTNKRNQDFIDKQFFSVQGVSSRKQLSENDENAWDLMDRKMALKCNMNMFDKKSTLYTQHDRIRRNKLQLTTQFR